DLGIAGLAILRNWIVGDEKKTQSILEEIHNIFSTEELSTSKEGAKRFDVKSGYQACSETYDSGPNILIDVEEPVVKSILRKIHLGRALDAACGTGRYAEFLHSLGHKVTGVDLSAEMLKKAKARNKHINFVQGNLFSLPLDDSEYDITICALAISHYPNITKILSELKRVTRPSGCIILSDIHPWFVVLGAQADFHDRGGKWGYIPNYIHWHSDYIQAFNSIGLKILTCKEPKIGQKEVELVQSLGSDLSVKTTATALFGLPVAVVWVLGQ
ncbi:MAG: class I SAM-dependent methyltransferase, partial [Candidatus Heimdallarchaeota archaeon]